MQIKSRNSALNEFLKCWERISASKVIQKLQFFFLSSSTCLFKQVFLMLWFEIELMPFEMSYTRDKSVNNSQKNPANKQPLLPVGSVRNTVLNDWESVTGSFIVVQSVEQIVTVQRSSWQQCIYHRKSKKLLSVCVCVFGQFVRRLCGRRLGSSSTGSPGRQSTRCGFTRVNTSHSASPTWPKTSAAPRSI